LQKKKVGLEMPYSKWMLSELRDIVEETLSENKLHATGLFNAKGVRHLWEEHKLKQFDHGRALWGLLNYMLWYDIYLKN
jgi:asparagine synthase (glutamine-hydrolysing)